MSDKEYMRHYHYPLALRRLKIFWRYFLTEKRDPEVVRAQLQAQLPPGLDLVAVEEAEVKKIDGSNGEKVSTLLESLEWYVGVVPGAENITAIEEGEEQGEESKQSSSFKSSARAAAACASSTPGATVNIEALKTAVEAVLAADSLHVTRPSKKRKGKINSADIRSGLMELEVYEVQKPSWHRHHTQYYKDKRCISITTA
ncbi:hypothetical protein Ndes2437B_g02833 [Nannochloris sp. 'desiccata']